MSAVTIPPVRAEISGLQGAREEYPKAPVLGSRDFFTSENEFAHVFSFMG